MVCVAMGVWVKRVSWVDYGLKYGEVSVLVKIKKVNKEKDEIKWFYSDLGKKNPMNNNRNEHKYVINERKDQNKQKNDLLYKINSHFISNQACK